jgi:hypothetical protein
VVVGRGLDVASGAVALTDTPMGGAVGEVVARAVPTRALIVICIAIALGVGVDCKPEEHPVSEIDVKVVRAAASKTTAVKRAMLHLDVRSGRHHRQAKTLQISPA